MIKVCGVRTVAEMDAAKSGGADLVGVWCGVPGGHADLAPRDAAELLGTGPTPRPVLVTLRRQGLAAWADGLGANWVQLHGHQSPRSVAALKDRDMVVIKVLHLFDGGECPEADLVPAYERAGTDLFLLDTAGPRGRIGSTGQPSDPAALLRVVERLDRPFLLAGGVRADNRHLFDPVVEHPGYLGVDVDSATRDGSGTMRRHRVARLAAAWGATRCTS